MANQAVAEVSKSLLDNSAKEIERRNMRVYNRARALNKLARLFLDRLKKLDAPDQITYESLNKFAQDAQKAYLVTDIDIKNWFPRLSPFFIMDRRKFLSVHEKAKLSLATLNDFLTKEYVKTKILEETFQFINDLSHLEARLAEVEAEKTSLQNERLPIENEITEIEQEIARLQSEGPVDQLLTFEAEIEKMNRELRHVLRHLQKPFIKVQALSTHGGGAGLTLDELDKLNQYLEKPFNALATEETGYPLLRQLLHKIARLMKEDKLKLKSDKARKAELAVNDILNGDSLAGMYARCIEVVARERQVLNSAKMEEVRSRLSAFQEKVELLKARRASIESHEAVKEREYNDTKERVDSTKRNIEKNVYTSLGQKIQIR
jgi:chromosome segregation ATPase